MSREIQASVKIATLVTKGKPTIRSYFLEPLNSLLGSMNMVPGKTRSIFSNSSLTGLKDKIKVNMQLIITELYQKSNLNPIKSSYS